MIRSEVTFALVLIALVAVFYATAASTPLMGAPYRVEYLTVCGGQPT